MVAASTLRFVLSTLTAAALLTAGSVAHSLATDAGGVHARAATFKVCKKKLKRKGHRYQIQRRKLSCGTARRKTGRVLKTRRAPRGWHCSLPNLPHSGSCWKGKGGKRSFVFHRIR